MIYKGKEIKGEFTHVCESKYGDFDEFTIFANIIKDKKETYLIERYQRFGTLQLDTVYLSKNIFNEYYKEINKENIIMFENTVSQIDKIINIKEQISNNDISQNLETKEKPKVIK